LTPTGREPHDRRRRYARAYLAAPATVAAAPEFLIAMKGCEIAVMALPPDERRDRARVNEAVRDGLQLGPLRPAGSADLYGAPQAEE
jgi:hypothetical protein